MIARDRIFEVLVSYARSRQVPGWALDCLAGTDAGDVELGVDDSREPLSWPDVTVPPDGEAVSLECVDERLDSCPVFARVTEEDVRHGYVLPPRAWSFPA